jgi:hypothetical protein
MAVLCLNAWGNIHIKPRNNWKSTSSSQVTRQGVVEVVSKIFTMQAIS